MSVEAGRAYDLGMQVESVPVAVAPLSRKQYDLLVAAGALDDERVELLGGRKVVMSPERAPHAEAIGLFARPLRTQGESRGLYVREGHPVALSGFDEPEPDVALVDDRSYAQEHPQPHQVHLLVEVSISSLAKDLGPKAAAYAAAGIPDYWVADLVGRRLVVHRDPGPDGYRSVEVVQAGSEVAPLALPPVTVDPATLPRATRD